MKTATIGTRVVRTRGSNVGMIGTVMDSTTTTATVQWEHGKTTRVSLSVIEPESIPYTIDYTGVGTFNSKGRLIRPKYSKL